MVAALAEIPNKVVAAISSLSYGRTVLLDALDVLHLRPMYLRDLSPIADGFENCKERSYLFRHKLKLAGCAP